MRGNGHRDDGEEPPSNRNAPRSREKREKAAREAQQTEHRVERIHDRASRPPLDDAALRVHRDVEDVAGPAERGNRHAPERNRRAEEEACRHAERGTEIDGSREDEAAAASKARHDRARERKAHEMADRPREKKPPLLGVGKIEKRLHVVDRRPPCRAYEPEDREIRGHRYTLSRPCNHTRFSLPQIIPNPGAEVGNRRIIPLTAHGTLRYNSRMNRSTKFFALSVALATTGGCRILETGYGDDNAVVRASVDAVSAATGAAKSTVSWAGARVLSFGDDLTPDRHEHFIAVGELAAAAYRNRPDLPKGYRPLASEEFSRMNLAQSRFRYEPDTGFVEDCDGAGFGARVARKEDGDTVAVAFRGSNAPGEDEHWMQDWVVDAQQGGGGTPKQYLCGAELLAAARRAFPDAELIVSGHSLGGGIASYATMMLPDPGRLACATYNAAGISSITLLSLPKDAVERTAGLVKNIRSKGDPVSAIPGTQLVGEVFEVDNLRFANHSIDGLLIDMRRRAEGRRAGWLRDLFDD